jgi:fructokinase
MTHRKNYDFICYGELLWDILPTGAKPGGAPMNVAFHLRKLGHRPAIITRVGKDERGDELLQILKEKDVDTSYVQVDQQVSTGIVHATPNQHGEMSYDIVAPAAWDNIEWNEKLKDLPGEENFLVFGSLICRNATSRDTLFQLIDAAQNTVLDINLRPPHYDEELLRTLLKKAKIVKLNQAELSLLSGWSSGGESVPDQMRSVQNAFDISTLVVTLGGDGAMMSKDGEITKHPGYHITVEDTVGSGDAFLAGLLSSVSQKKPPAVCLSFACALGALVTSRKGAWPDYQVDEIYSLREK